MATHLPRALSTNTVANEQAATGPGGALPALLALAAAIVCWSVGEDWRQEMTPLTQQLQSVSALSGRGSQQEIEKLQNKAQEVLRQREQLQRQLVSDGDLELVRAYLNADLRLFCLNSLAKNCVVRLADDALTNAVNAPAPSGGIAAGAANGNKVSLESLGVLRARATVSGLFETNEPQTMLMLMRQDQGRTWRVNGVVVRGNSFEVDVERLVLMPSATSPSKR
jgi:hypothetical protein